jgi:hypothetical protein
MQSWEEMSTNLLGKLWAGELLPEEVSATLTTWSKNEPATNESKAYDLAIETVGADAPLFNGFTKLQKTLALELLRLLSASPHPRQRMCWLLHASVEAMQGARAAITIPSSDNDGNFFKDSPRSAELFPVLLSDNEDGNESAWGKNMDYAGSQRVGTSGSISKDVLSAEGHISGACSKNALFANSSDDAGLSTAYPSPSLPHNPSPLTSVRQDSPASVAKHVLSPVPKRGLNVGPPSDLPSSDHGLHAIMEGTLKKYDQPMTHLENRSAFAQLDSELRQENAEACVEAVLCQETTSKASDDEDVSAWAWFSPLTKPSSCASSHVDLDLAAKRQDAVREAMKGRSRLLLTLLPEWGGPTAQKVQHVAFSLFATKIQAAWHGHLLRKEFAMPLAAAVMVDRVVDKVWCSFSEKAQCQVRMLLRSQAAVLQMTTEVHQAKAATMIQTWWRNLLKNPTPLMRRFWRSMEYIDFEG